MFARDRHFGFVWECDDENAEAECRRPTNPLDKMFYFETFGVTKLLHGFSLLPERSVFTCLSTVVWSCV